MVISELTARLITGTLLSICVFFGLAWLPSPLLCGITLCILLYALCVEWPQFNALRLTVLYPVLPFVCLAYLTFDKRWLAIMIATVVTHDTFSYFGGKLLGKHKLAPSISPGKTIEGFLIGSICSFICGYFVALVLFLHAPYKPWIFTQVAVIILGIILSATAGDLFESYLKRQAHIKDSGSILPGHGGVLDRFDSLIMAATFLVIVLWLIN